MRNLLVIAQGILVIIALQFPHGKLQEVFILASMFCFAVFCGFSLAGLKKR